MWGVFQYDAQQVSSLLTLTAFFYTTGKVSKLIIAATKQRDSIVAVVLWSPRTQDKQNRYTVSYTWSELGDGTQQVVVDDWRGVLGLFPAHWGGGRGGDQELLLWFRGLQPWTPDVDRLQTERHE